METEQRGRSRTDRAKTAVNNDFHQSKSLFELFRGLQVDDLTKPVKATAIVNGDHEANGTIEPQTSEVTKAAVEAAKAHQVAMPAE